MTAEPLIELEVREMRCIPGRKCDLAESYSRLSIAIEIDAGELHIAGDGFRTLEAGQKVSYEMANGPKGLEARNVRVLSRSGRRS